MEHLKIRLHSFCSDKVVSLIPLKITAVDYLYSSDYITISFPGDPSRFTPTWALRYLSLFSFIHLVLSLVSGHSSTSLYDSNLGFLLLNR